MPKTRLIICLMLLASVSCWATGNAPFETKLPCLGGNNVLPMMGHVRSVRAEFSVVEEQAGKVTKTPRQLGATVEFDRNGNVTEAVEYEPTRLTKWTYHHDASGNATEALHTECRNPKAADPKFEPVERYTATYDANGSMLEQFCYRQGKCTSMIKLSYNPNGKVRETAIYEPPAELCRKTTELYDSKGNRTGTICEDADGTFKRIVQVYDSAGRMVGSSSYDKSGRLGERLVVSYHDGFRETSYLDGAGKLKARTVYRDYAKISDRSYNPDGSPFRKMDCSYQRDKQGNAIVSVRREQRYKDGKLQGTSAITSYRTITYYN